MSAKVYVTVGVDKRSIPAGGLAGEFLVKASNDDYDFVWSEVSGTGAERQPSTGPSPKDTGALGIRGTSVNYARQDHQHPLNVDDSVNPSMDGTVSPGDDDYYARRDHIHPRNTSNAVKQLNDLTLNTTWTTVTNHQHYTKTVTFAGQGPTKNSKIDLCATYDSILQMDSDGTLAIYVENDGADTPTFTIHAVGEKPTASLTFAVYKTEII